MDTLQRLLPSTLDYGQRRVLIKAARYLSAIGVLWFANKVLSGLSLNHWRLRRQGEPWVFDGQKELAIVTGGSSGFGRLIVKGLASKLRVVVLDVLPLPEDLEALPSVSFYHVDLTSPTSIASTCATIKSTHGAPSILINNAGIATSHTLLDTSDEWLEKIFRVNTLCHFQLIREFLPGMLEQRKGHVVTLASMASYAATAGLVDYGATKSAAMALHNGLRQELIHRYPAGPCINTTIVCPMWARTAIIKTWQTSLVAHKAPVLEPEQVADAVVEQVLAGRSGYIYLPRHMGLLSGMWGFPVWLQDMINGSSARLTVPGVGG